MKASKLIKILSTRIEIFGDYEVVYWDDGAKVELEINDVFGDEDDETICISNTLATIDLGV